MLARHVSDLTGPSSGAFYKLYLQIWYVVIRVLLDTSSRYEVVTLRLPWRIWLHSVQRSGPDEGVGSCTCFGQRISTFRQVAPQYPVSCFLNFCRKSQIKIIYLWFTHSVIRKIR